MSIFKTRAFAKDAELQGLTDEAVKQAVEEVRKGLIDANLGGHLVKKRVAVGNKGKSGGLRTIIVYKASADDVFCVYVFAKKDASNISTKQLEELKLLAKTLLAMKKVDMDRAQEAGALQEIQE